MEQAAKVATRETGVIVQAWVSPDAAADLKRCADEDRRSVSALVRNLIEDHLQQQGKP